jgi:hypothetical protein
VPPLRHALPALCALLLASAAGPGRAAGERPTVVTVDAPVINFRIPTFTRQGFRSWLLCGAEGRYLDANELVVTNLNLTVFSGDAANGVEYVFLSPTAVARPNDGQVRGPGVLRLIATEFEATGEDWLYDHRQKKISLHRNVRVVFHAPLKSLF